MENATNMAKTASHTNCLFIPFLLQVRTFTILKTESSMHPAFRDSQGWFLCMTIKPNTARIVAAAMKKIILFADHSLFNAIHCNPSPLFFTLLFSIVQEVIAAHL